MTMDPSLRRGLEVLSNPNFGSVPRFRDDTDLGVFLETGHGGYCYPRPHQTPGTSLSSDSPEEDSEVSEMVLNYITQILMEEDIEDKSYMLHQETLDLEAAEKPFYEALGKKYPPSPEQNFRGCVFQNGDSPDENFSTNFTDSGYYGGAGCVVDDNTFIPNLSEYGSQLLDLPGYGISQSSCYSSSNSVISSVDGLLESPSSSVFQVPDFGGESRSIWQFRKGVEEASRFLPSKNELCVDAEMNLKVAVTGESSFTAERKDDGGSKGRKNHHYRDEDDDDVAEKERRNKQAAIYIESTLRSKMFDLVLLCNNGAGERHLSSVRETMKNEIDKVSSQKSGQSKGSSLLPGGKGRGRGIKKLGAKKEVVDLRTLLIQCAQAVAADDHRTANQLLKQVRKHASPYGDGNERLANCFADGLEARLAGTGGQIYKGLVSKRVSASDMLKTYMIYLAACPFRKVSHFASNKTILNSTEKATKIHIIDFGILYGFQWPTFIHRLSKRDGGPPKLRITGVEFPQPGFRPAELVEETGRRLKAYAESFEVPFEYNAIAKKWESVTLEELKIEKEEFLVVNCLYRGKNLLDESVMADSPRNVVLDLVKRINPDICIQGIVNGAYNAPFFVTRFREALFHFSAIFDMLETIVPRGEPERMLIEREFFGREALNIIACEGWERVERAETYKQWHIRIMRSGFSQQPFCRDIVTMAKNKVRSNYHRDFMIDEDSGWLLQGWKGRIIFALSSWKPT